MRAWAYVVVKVYLKRALGGVLVFEGCLPGEHCFHLFLSECHDERHLLLSPKGGYASEGDWILGGKRH